MRRDSEREAQEHAGRVVLHRRVDESLDVGERDDFVELARLPGARMPEDGAAQEDVLAAGQLGVKARADLEQRTDTAAHLHPALGRIGDAGEDLEQRALAGAVSADEADDFPGFQIERHVAQRPERVGRLRDCAAPRPVTRFERPR